MKTLCAWDNVACLVDTFQQLLDQVSLAFVAIVGAILIAYIVASVAKGN